MSLSVVRRLARIPVALFVLWHAFAVAAYSIPSSATDPVSHLIRQRVTPEVSPYILWTSQWQQWNLFSPDPLRRVEKYRIEQQTASGWETVQPLAASDIRRWRRADELKILRFLVEHDWAQPLRARYAQSYCRPLGLAPGTPVRLSHAYWVIPYINDAHLPIPRPQQSQWADVPGVPTVCPPEWDPLASIFL